MKTVMMLGLAMTVGLGGCASVGMRRSLVRTEPTCQDVTTPIYFEPNQASLTRDGRRVIPAAAAAARGCAVQSVRVLGLADAGGDATTNQALSQRRAESVTAALIEAKPPPAEFAVTAAGEAGAETASGQAQPVRRRADVVLKLGKLK